MNINIDSIIPNPQQPREVFDQADLEKLASSIQDVGLINPIAVEDNGDDTYILIDGERRWRACKLLGMDTIEASVKPSRNGTGESYRLASAVTANMQRSDMNLIEQARAISDLFKQGYRMPDVMRIMGFDSQSPIDIRMNLISFSPTIQDLYARGALPLDTRLVQLIKRIPEDQVDAFLTRCAARNMPASRILATWKYMQTMQKKRKTFDTVSEQKTFTGAMDLTRNKNLTEQLTQNVAAVCNRCEMTTKEICLGCPMLDLLDMWT